MARVKHPPCPKCGRALYKSKEKGAAVKKDDPFAYCRNEKCPSNSKAENVQKKPPAPEPRLSRAQLRKRRRARTPIEAEKKSNKKDELLSSIRKTVIETVVKKRGDIGFLCFIALVVRQLGFQDEYETIVKRCDLGKILGD